MPNIPNPPVEDHPVTREDVLAAVDPALREVYGHLFDLGWRMEISRLHSGELPEEPVYKWTQKVSAWGGGPVLQSFNENGGWLDLLRIVYNKSYADEDAKEIVLSETEDGNAMHFKFGVNYSAYKMKHFTDYIYAKRDSDLAIATAAHVSAAKIAEYKVFVRKVLKGYSAVDLAIEAGEDRYETAKALLGVEDFNRIDKITKLSFACKSLWVRNDVSLEPERKAIYDEKVKSGDPAYNVYLKVHSKFAVAVGSGNIVIAKFIVHDLDYVPTEEDYSDIGENFRQKAFDFAKSLSADDEIEEPILLGLAGVGIELGIEEV